MITLYHKSKSYKCISAFWVEGNVDDGALSATTSVLYDGDWWAVCCSPHFWLSNAHYLPLVSHSYSKSTWFGMNWLRRWDIWLCNACSRILPVICTRHPVVRNHSFLLMLHWTWWQWCPAQHLWLITKWGNAMQCMLMLTIPFIIIVHWLFLILGSYKGLGRIHLSMQL